MTLSRTALAAACLLTFGFAAGAHAQASSTDLGARVGAKVDALYPHLETIYKDVHAHPELGFQETRTASLLAAEMRAIGFQVTEHVGKTGLVAIYRNGAGPTVLVRTELDALPMEEKTGLPYASRAKANWQGHETFVAHSCGHDVHMASWIGTARTLVDLKDQWHGTLMFIAQPAEELGAGARAMLDDGLFTRFPKPDIAFALHTDPAPLNTVEYNVGAVTSNADSFEITFKGRGGHGSAPHMTLDPVLMAAHFITDVQSVVSREKDPFEFGVVTVGAVQAGSAGNIIPDSAVLRGTIRSYKPEVRAKLLEGLRRTARAEAQLSNAPEPEVTLTDAGSAVVNDERIVATTEAVLKANLGAGNVKRVPPITASEDFSEYGKQGVPSMFFFVGVIDPQQFADAKKPGGKPVPFNHSPMFAPVPEPSIKTGVKAMSLAVMNVMQAR
jgi:hippurate hydrolase